MRPKPSRVSAFRNCFGTIWSVSTLTRSSGITMPVWVENGCIFLVSEDFKRFYMRRLDPVSDALLNAIRAIRRNDVVRDSVTFLMLIAFTHQQKFDFGDFSVRELDTQSFVLMFSTYTSLDCVHDAAQSLDGRDAVE